jgi:hypothetical protein
MPRPMTILAEGPQPGQKVSPISDQNVAGGRPKRRAGVTSDGGCPVVRDGLGADDDGIRAASISSGAAISSTARKNRIRRGGVRFLRGGRVPVVLHFRQGRLPNLGRTRIAPATEGGSGSGASPPYPEEWLHKKTTSWPLGPAVNGRSI